MNEKPLLRIAKIIAAVMTICIFIGAVWAITDKNLSTPYVQNRSHPLIDKHVDSLGQVINELQIQLVLVKKDEINRNKVQRALQEATMTPEQIQKARDKMILDSVPPGYIYGR